MCAAGFMLPIQQAGVAEAHTALTHAAPPQSEVEELCVAAQVGLMSARRTLLVVLTRAVGRGWGCRAWEWRVLFTEDACVAEAQAAGARSCGPAVEGSSCSGVWVDEHRGECIRVSVQFAYTELCKSARAGHVANAQAAAAMLRPCSEQGRTYCC